MPEAATAYYGAGNIYYNQENFNEAKNMYEKALKKGLDQGDLHYMLAMSLVAIDQSRLALPYFGRAVELNEEDCDARFQFGLCLARLDFVDEAMVQFQTVVELDEDHADGYYNLGVAYAYKENATKAKEMLERALTIQPDHLLAGHALTIINENNMQ